MDSCRLWGQESSVICHPQPDLISFPAVVCSTRLQGYSVVGSVDIFELLPQDFDVEKFAMLSRAR